MTDRTAALLAEIREQEQLDAQAHADAVVEGQIVEVAGQTREMDRAIADLLARVEALDALPPDQLVNYPALADQVAQHIKRQRGER